MKGGGPCWLLGYTHPSVSAGSCFQCGAFYISARKELSCSKHLHCKVQSVSNLSLSKPNILEIITTRDAPICEEFENAPDFFCNGQRLRDT